MEASCIEPTWREPACIEPAGIAAAACIEPAGIETAVCIEPAGMEAVVCIEPAGMGASGIELDWCMEPLFSGEDD